LCRWKFPPRRGLAAFAVGLFLTILWLPCDPLPARAQDVPQDVLEEAARATGLSKDELLRRYQQQVRQQGAAAGDTTGQQPPGRQTLPASPQPVGRGEASYWPEKPEVTLPMAPGEGEELTAEQAEEALEDLEGGEELSVFGRNFFELDAGVFAPTTFGPVPPDYRIGVGDELVVDVWGEVEFRESRIVERDGSIILPKGGKIFVHNRTLADVQQAIRDRLARSYSGIEDGTIHLDVTLGALRTIRVFVVGDATQPGAYELSSVATVFTALYASGGPGDNGSLRDVRLMRGGEQVASLDLYDYLMRGVRDQDAMLHDGDTVFIPQRGRTVLLQGAVRRPAFYELKAGESVEDLLRFGGGFTPRAVTGIVHIERIVPPPLRARNQPDRTFVDVALDPATAQVAEPDLDLLLDGDVVTVDAIEDRLWGWVEVAGHVKHPGRYQFRAGLTASELIDEAGGVWPDALLDVAVIDRVDERERTSTVSFDLGAVLRGEAQDPPLTERDVLRVFSYGAMIDRELVYAQGAVREPGQFEFREGMTLKDVLVRAGGVPNDADLSRVEIQRLRSGKVYSNAAERPAGDTVEVITVDLRPDWLAAGGGIALAPYDRVVVRRLPWYELQRQVTIQGEVLYNGSFSLTEKDETLSSVIARAGGLKPTAYPPGARIERQGSGNVAIDLAAALAEPGGPQDIILEAGDRVLVPERQYTVRVMGEVGFPTSLIYEDGHDIDWYVKRAGGFLEKADKNKARVIHPNGLAQSNEHSHRVLPGSTIIVPVKPPPEGKTTLETVRDITALLASLATVWLVIDNTTN